MENGKGKFRHSSSYTYIDTWRIHKITFSTDTLEMPVCYDLWPLLGVASMMILMKHMMIISIAFSFQFRCRGDSPYDLPDR